MTAYVAFPCDISSLYKAARFSVPDIIIPSLSAVQLQSSDPSVCSCHCSAVTFQNSIHNCTAWMHLSPHLTSFKSSLSPLVSPRELKPCSPKNHSRQDPQRVHLPPAFPFTEHRPWWPAGSHDKLTGNPVSLDPLNLRHLALLIWKGNQTPPRECQN